MSVRFVLGAAGTGKTHYCIEQLAGMINEQPLGSPLLFLLPQQATFIHERQLAEACAGSGFCRAEVASFVRLARRAAAESGKALPQQHSEAGKLLQMQALVQQHAAKLQQYAAVSKSAGFAAQLLAAAEEMQIYGVSAEALLAAAEKLPEEQSSLAARLREIGLLYSGYAEAEEGGYARRMSFLAERINEGFLADTQVFIDGYAQFTPCEMEVVAALMRNCPSVTIALCLDADRAEQPITRDDPFYPLWISYAALRETAEKAGAELLPPILLKRGKGRWRDNAELALLEQHFAGYAQPPQQAAPQHIRLLMLPDCREELLFAGREIKRLVREQGLRYREISLICRDLQPYEDLLPDTFGQLELPYFIDSKKPLRFHPLVELVSAALQLWAERPHYAQMMRLLKNRFSPVFGAAADKLDNYCLAHGIRFYHWQRLPWQFPLLERAGESSEYLAEINAIAAQAVPAVMRFLAELTENGTARQFNAALLRLMQEWQVERQLQQLADDALAAGKGEDAAEHSQALDILLDFLAEAEEVLAETPLSARQLQELYATALHELSFSTIPAGSDQLLVNSLERSRTPEIRAEFLLGVSEGSLPQRVVMQGLFRDEDREQLARLGLHLAADSATRQFAENYLAYIGLTRSSELLYISYPELSGDGETMPSPLIRRLQELFPALQVEAAPIASSALLSGSAADLPLLSVGLRQDRENPLWQAMQSNFVRRGKYAEHLQQIGSGLSFSPQTSGLSRHTLQRFYRNRLRSSVSRLEAFRRCPFAYFAGYGLRLQQRRTFSLQPADRGDLYHAVLADVGLYLRENQIPWSSVDEQLAALLVENSLSAHLPQFLSGIMQSSARYAYISGRIKQALVRAVLLQAEQMRHGQFIPIAIELPFGSSEQGSLPQFVIPLADGRVLELSGRIDRVDMAEDAESGQAFFRIIDYKTGQQRLDKEDIAAGLRLQLMVYLAVVLGNAEAFTLYEPRPAGVYYATVNDAVHSVSGPAEQVEPPKLEGLTLADARAVLLADQDIDGTSSLLKLDFNRKSGKLSSRGNALLEQEEYQQMQQQLTALLQQTASAMLDGMVQVSPLVDEKHNACAYCDYQAVCGFDRELAAPRSSAQGLSSLLSAKEEVGKI